MKRQNVTQVEWNCKNDRNEGRGKLGVELIRLPLILKCGEWQVVRLDSLRATTTAEANIGTLTVRLDRLVGWLGERNALAAGLHDISKRLLADGVSVGSLIEGHTEAESFTLLFEHRRNGTSFLKAAYLLVARLLHHFGDIGLEEISSPDVVQRTMVVMPDRTVPLGRYTWARFVQEIS